MRMYGILDKANLCDCLVVKIKLTAITLIYHDALWHGGIKQGVNEPFFLYTIV